jgi:nicotinate-nucleotide adenylyltransferase
VVVDTRKRVGLLTGTFDPIHNGHIALALAAQKACKLVEVWLLVDPKRENAESERKPSASAFKHRLAMAHLACDRHPSIRVYDGEMADKPHNIVTFLELMSRYPENKFIFIVGMDTMLRLDRWPSVETVVKSTSFAISNRPSASSSGLDELRESLGDLGQALNVHLFALDHDEFVSSSGVRSVIAKGKRPNNISKDVYEYILENNLYNQKNIDDGKITNER